jgi:hypothetical protein
MTLEDLVENINHADGNLVIFQMGELNINSEVALLQIPEEESFEIVRNGVKYIYLIEVFIAQEFISGWLSNLKEKPNTLEIAQRLFHYAINDA